MAKVEHQLTNEMVAYLQGGSVVLLNAVEPTSNNIYTTALSWVYAIDAKTIRFAIDSKSDFISIIESDPRVVLNFVGLESTYSVNGNATVKVKQTEGLTLKLALVEVEVQAVRDIMFYGGKITHDPAFTKTYNADLIVKLDNEVKGALTNL